MLSDRDATECVRNGELCLEALSEGSPTPNGYAPKIGEIMVDYIRVAGGDAQVKPLTSSLSAQRRLSFEEEMAAQLWLPSS
ncbi:MAG: hypothetical protein ACE5QW_04660 [Thermoplasmata archaeon]